MDEKFVQGVVGGVLSRHKDRTLDKKRIQTLMVEIAANIDLVYPKHFGPIKETPGPGLPMKKRWETKGLAKDNPLSIEMWKGYNPNEHFNKVKEEELSKEYLDYWTCDYCNKNTHEIDYDYLSGTDHLECCLKAEALQEKSDKIIKTLDEKMKDFDLSKSESNENSKVDMSEKASRGKK